MSLLDLTGMIDEIEDAPEPTVADSGTEHKLRIISCRGGEAHSKNSGRDCEYISPVFEVPDAPLVKEFSTFLWIPEKKKLTEKDYARALSDFRIFIKCFGIDISQAFEYQDHLPGHVGWAILGIKDNDEYGEQNTIRKFILPQ